MAYMSIVVICVHVSTTIFSTTTMRYFHTRTAVLLGLSIFGAGFTIIGRLRYRRSESAARERNKAACDVFIRKHGLPDYGFIVCAIDGVARQFSRQDFCELDQQSPPDTLQGRRKEGYVVVSAILIIKLDRGIDNLQPDDMEYRDIALYERWLVAPLALEETRQDSPVISLSRQVQHGWQPPPTWAFDGCSAKKNEALWRKCLEHIGTDISRESKSQSRDNMKACLGWIKLYGYPSSY